MFELMVVACVGPTICEHRFSPIAYASEERCAHQAALIAGMSAGRWPPGREVTYRFRCQAADGEGEAEWVMIERDGILVPGRDTAAAE
ncbi:MAG: hypothetical protein RID91_22585 [Azospirillaceae bacterium]